MKFPKLSDGEESLAIHIRALRLPDPVREFRFHPERKWRFDFAWPDRKIAVEVEGGVFLPKGGHTTGVGYTKNCEKYNAAALLGWVVLRYTSAMVREGVAYRDLEGLFAPPDLRARTAGL